MLKQEFEDYLVTMQQVGLISGWKDRLVQQGTDWSQTIDLGILTTELVLLFMSTSLLASGYCSGVEVRKVLERSETGRAKVIPIILNHVNLTGNPLEAVQPLLINGIPVSSWSDRSKVWWNIDNEIRSLLLRW